MIGIFDYPSAFYCVMTQWLCTDRFKIDLQFECVAFFAILVFELEKAVVNGSGGASYTGMLVFPWLL